MTPNILAISHLFEETLPQYFRSSLWAPDTLSTTSSVLASIRSLPSISTRPRALERAADPNDTYIISLCSETIVANCPKILPNSVMVFSMASMASPLCCM